MKNRFRIAGFLLVLGAVCLGVAPGLWAQSSNVGCGYLPAPARRAVVRPASFVQVSGVGSDGAAIVGLWKFNFVSEGNPGIPDGTILDDGLATWHSDGTELMNSGLRPPMTGNFCTGVWKQTGSSTYKLNHIGLSWDPTGTTYVGPANIRLRVTISQDGNSYSGTFTIDQYDTNGVLLVHLKGNVVAKRVTVD
jgi:hypothetical protein